jgi:hypothetical protein
VSEQPTPRLDEPIPKQRVVEQVMPYYRFAISNEIDSLGVILVADDDAALAFAKQFCPNEHTESSALMVIGLGWHVTAAAGSRSSEKELLILLVGNSGVFDFEQTPRLKKRILRSASTISR